jgi:hypothetical protein
MLDRNSARIALCSAALAFTLATAQAADPPKYPDWSGQWQRIAVQGVRGQPSYDPTKPWGNGQQAPLTPEYQAVLEANLKDQENGGHGGLVGWTCRPYGMPMMMYGFTPLEFVVTPKTTYVLINLLDTMRRIYTDNRAMPDDTDTRPAAGSIRTATASTTRSKSKPGTSRARASTTRPASPSTPTTNPSSRNASTSTRATPASCTTRSRRSITR